MILNGGSISGTGSIAFGTNTGNELDIYTSLGNGTINSNISSGDILTKFGPGTLFLTGNNTAVPTAGFTSTPRAARSITATFNGTGR